MGLTAIAAAARSRAPLAAIAAVGETSPGMAAATRAHGMVGWEGELARRAAGASLEQAAAMLRWWPADVVQSAVATARARPVYDEFVRAVAEVEQGAARAVLGRFAFLEALVSDLEWLVFRCEPEGRPQLAASLRQGFPGEVAPRIVSLAVALSRFREDCDLRAWERVGVVSALEVMLLEGREDPALFGWPTDVIDRARQRLDDAGVAKDAAALVSRAHQEADVLAADPWETMTESRRTRALGVIEAAADTVSGLPRG